MQEPSPFSHVSGMKNRFECLIQGLRAAGDHVMVFTPDSNPPQEYFGAKVRNLLQCLPFYIRLQYVERQFDGFGNILSSTQERL